MKNLKKPVKSDSATPLEVSFSLSAPWRSNSFTTCALPKLAATWIG